FMAEHQTYFALLDVERTDDAIAVVLQKGSDVYADDVRRLVIEAQRDRLVPEGDPDFFTVGILGAVSSFSHAHRRGTLIMPIDELARFVGEWVTQATSGRATTPTPDLGAPSPG
ncbi:MAG: hypothetical protein WCI22_08490, partial [Actinomycetota bacterium]